MLRSLTGLLLLASTVAIADDLGVTVQVITEFATSPGEAVLEYKNNNPGAYFNVEVWGGSIASSKNLAFHLDETNTSVSKRCENQNKDCTEDSDCAGGNRCVDSVCEYTDSDCFPLSLPNPCPNGDTCETIIDNHAGLDSDCGCEIEDGEYLLAPNTASFTVLGFCNMHHHKTDDDCDETCDDQGRCMMPHNDQGAYLTEVSFDGSCFVAIDAADSSVEWLPTHANSECQGRAVCP